MVRPVRINQTEFDNLLRQNATGNLVMSSDLIELSKAKELLLDPLLKRAVVKGHLIFIYQPHSDHAGVLMGD